jgi:protease PrsW
MAAPPPRPVLDTRRFGRTPPAFLGILGVCCVIALLALVEVLLQRGPAPAPVGLLLALLPIPLLLSIVLYLDRLEPEPRALLAAMFGAGAGIAAVTAFAGLALHTGVITIPELGSTRCGTTRSARAAVRWRPPTSCCSPRWSWSSSWWPPTGGGSSR